MKGSLKITACILAAVILCFGFYGCNKVTHTSSDGAVASPGNADTQDA